MSNLTTVTLTAGVPTAGTGTVSTLDGIFGGQIAIKPGSTPAVAGDAALVVALSPNGLNANGATNTAGSAPVALATDQVTLSVAQDTTQLANGVTGTMVAKNYAIISASSSGPTTIVAAVGGKSIRVVQWIIKVNAPVNFKWQSHVTPTDISGLFYNSGQGDGAGASFCPVGHFQTVSGEALDLNLSGSVAVGGYLVYVLI